MKDKYVVTYRINDGDIHEIFAKVTSGTDIAYMVGFSDCFDMEIIEIMEVSSTGILMPCWLHFPDHAPFNRVLIEDVCGSIKEFEWAEH